MLHALDGVRVGQGRGDRRNSLLERSLRELHSTSAFFQCLRSTIKFDEVDNVEDEKRKTSLEKNRLAAAKCRVNKKEGIEALQRDSHDKAI